MNRLNAVFALGLTTLAVGCGAPEPAERVTVVIVDCQGRAPFFEAKDCNTVVEFPNGERRARPGRWGKVGDQFTASRFDPALSSGGDGWR